MNKLALIPLLVAATGFSVTQVWAQDNANAIQNPFRGVMQDRSSRSADEALYVEKCSMCHRQMGMGTVLLSRRVDPAEAMLEQRDNLTEGYITLAARQGIGNMPRITKAEVSDAQLAQIARYLVKGKAQ